MTREAAGPGAPNIDALADGVLKGERRSLARAITLVESNAGGHRQAARALLRRLLPHSGDSIRVGVTGAPGAGKSTLIEALGMQLTDAGMRVAVLAIDPSSSRSGGSILGDKTRMSSLARSPGAFIRPSPSAGTPGGVASKTRECILLCEAAGHEVVLLETVGSGQGEVAARSMVDFFLLLLLTGAGDGLQGIKKGVMELADAIAINKADGDNQSAARAAAGETRRALRTLAPANGGWQPQVVTCSALEGTGISELWTLIEQFRRSEVASGDWQRRRREQRLAWLHERLEEGLREAYFSQPWVRTVLPELEGAVMAGDLGVADAVPQLLTPEAMLSPLDETRA